MNSLGSNGVLQVVPPAALEAQLNQKASMQAQAQQSATQQPAPPDLIGYVKGQFEIFRNHRNTQSGWSERLLVALRTFNGQYAQNKLQEIRRFGGSEVYMRLIAQKCRAASSLLRDIYLGNDRPWALKPASEVEIPDDIQQKIDTVIQSEYQMVQQQMGTPPSATDMMNRHRLLTESAEDAARKQANEQAQDSEDKIDDILREGGFYHALAEFLVDLPIFPFACIKGPVVKIIPKVTWPKGGGKPSIQMTPTLTWVRVSPFDLWWSPGVSDIENANVIEKSQITRAELNDLLDLPGYNTSEVYAVLDEYGRGGLYDNWDTTDAERAVLESRENPAWNRSNMISMMEFNGNVQGRVLTDYGMQVQDPLRDYHVQVWCIGNHVIKAHMSPSPRQRHPYFITSFEKVPGTPLGNGLTDLLTDVQECCNATLRALVNNLSIASGPQVVIDDDQLDPAENTEQLYPWKKWHARKSPVARASTNKPVEFFQPNDNSDKLIKVIQEFVGIADDVSAIPKYVGGSAGGNAGRTASGLAMLMGNASKILQTVSANIDRDVMEPALLQLFDLILLTDTTGLLTGEENVSIQGVQVAIQRETQRQRQMEFLQATANPMDSKIIGIKGRGQVLRAVSKDIGLPGDEIVPEDGKLDQMQQAEQQAQQNGPIQQAVDKGVTQGVQAGVQRITTELTSGILAERSQMPEGPSVHIGTPPGAEGGGQEGTSGAGPPGGGSQNKEAAQAQGNKTSPQATGHMGPQTSLVGNQPGAGAKPIQGGPT